MVDYSIEFIETKNGIATNKSRIIQFKSEIVDRGLSEDDRKQLIKEILDSLKDVENPVITEIVPTFNYLKSINSYPEIRKESEKLWKEALDSKEEKIKIIKWRYKESVEYIKNIIEDSKSLELLDTQEFLNFMDDINKLSIDPDRK